MRRFLLSLIFLLANISFSSGVFYSVIDASGTTWSQVLTFTIKQKVSITWAYNENDVIPVDDTTSKGFVGFLNISSNKPIKLSADVKNFSEDTPSVEYVKIGSVNIPLNQTIHIQNKILTGDLIISFALKENPEISEFTILLEFTFFPF